MKVGLVCGGPSPERGISLNSARSVLDHLSSPEVEIVAIYLDHQKNAYKISNSQLYSNTPSDFDFKLHQTATAFNFFSQTSFCGDDKTAGFLTDGKKVFDDEQTL